MQLLIDKPSWPAGTRYLEIILMYLASIYGYKLLLNFMPAGIGYQIILCFSLFVYLPLLISNLLHQEFRVYSICKIRPRREFIVLLSAIITVLISCWMIAATGKQIFGIHLHYSVSAKNLVAFSMYQIFVVAFSEEYFFRGYLLSRLLPRKNEYLTLLNALKVPTLYISAGLFMLFHYMIEPGYASLLIFIPGYFYALLRVMSAGIVIPIIAHATSNIASHLIVYS